jgi:hypothetical protein
LKAQDLIIAVPTGNKKVKSAQLFKDKSNVKILTTTKDMTILQLPKLDENELDTVVELSF